MADEDKVRFEGFGFPKFWEHVYTQHKEFFQRIVALQDAVNSLTMRAYRDAETCQRLILNLVMLVGVSMMEVVTLVGNGFGQGAMKIVRGLMENAINAEYLRLNPGQCQNYLDWHWVEQHKLLNWAKEHNASLHASISEETKKLIEDNYEKVKRRFENRMTWCELNLAERAARTGFEQSYKVIMPNANQILHGTIGGLSRHFDLEQDEHRIAIPPSDDWGGEALIAAHESTLKAIETLSKTFNVTPEPSLQSLIDDFHFVWSRAKNPSAPDRTT